MKALVYTATMESEIREVDAPVAVSGQTIVRLALCGICGSDMHAWHGHDERRVPPLVLGHESVGIAMNGPHAGARVAINPLISCHECDVCEGGNPHLCAKRELIGMRIPGAFAEQVMVPDRNVIPLDDAVTFENATLAEPTAVAVRTVVLARRGGSTPTDRVVVLGGGAIGLLCAQVLIAYGYAPPMVAETNPLRRRVLDELGICQTYDPRETAIEDGSVDLVIDAVGMGATRAASTAMLRPGGVLIHVGLQDNDAGLDTRRMTLQEITFIGTYCYTPDDFAEALAMLTDGRVSGAGWTDLRPLDDGAAAFIDIHEGQAAPKIILSME